MEAVIQVRADAGLDLGGNRGEGQMHNKIWKQNLQELLMD